MRKKVLGLFMAALALGTFGAFAQTESDTTPQTCEQTSQDCKKDKKKERKDKDCDKKDCKKDKDNCFEGIELTEEQQLQIDQLDAACKAKKDEAREAAKAAKVQQQQEYSEAVEQILTPEQFKIYKDNCEKARESKKEKHKEKIRRNMHQSKGGSDVKVDQIDESKLN